MSINHVEKVNEMCQSLVLLIYVKVVD
uniref:Uncharacterized protein n=1 Tax=Heterorhabditis bacteriophora TaxID=37862 RepID=A0A1I7W769_HETBA